jgi:hypothetical protein
MTFNESGIWTDKMIRYFAVGPETYSDDSLERRRELLFRAIWKDHLPVTNRQEFVAAAEAAWRAYSEPYDYQVIAVDNAHSWALHWSAMWGARAVLGENRAPGVNMMELFSSVRGAARMANVPWGLWPAHDWYTEAQTPSVFKGDFRKRSNPDAKPSLSYQKARGWQYLPKNYLRRVAYYGAMNNPVVVADEPYAQWYIDATENHDYRLTWYGHVQEEVLEFTERYPDRGTPYTPIGILLSWDNGLELSFDRSFRRWEYNDEERAAKKLFRSVLYPNQGRRGHQQDIFGATPHGDLFDTLRLNTSQGPLPLALLENYRVLLRVGKQDFDPASLTRLKEYEDGGGTVVTIKANMSVGKMHEIIKHLVKRLLPFEITGDHVVGRVLYQVNRKDQGWVISLYNNDGIDSGYGKAAGRTWPIKRVNVQIRVAADITNALEWIGNNRLTITDRRINVPLDPGEVRIVEIQPEAIQRPAPIGPQNLALGQPATASSSAPGHGPAKAVNGREDIYDAWWSREFAPQWLQVDLGSVQLISSVRLLLAWSEDDRIFPRVYQHKVEVSTNGTEWGLLLDDRKNVLTAHPRGHWRHFDPVDARYVKVTITRNTAGTGGQIVELGVYGD